MVHPRTARTRPGERAQPQEIFNYPFVCWCESGCFLFRHNVADSASTMRPSTMPPSTPPHVHKIHKKRKKKKKQTPDCRPLCKASVCQPARCSLTPPTTRVGSTRLCTGVPPGSSSRAQSKDCHFAFLKYFFLLSFLLLPFDRPPTDSCVHAVDVYAAPVCCCTGPGPVPGLRGRRPGAVVWRAALLPLSSAQSLERFFFFFALRARKVN